MLPPYPTSCLFIVLEGVSLPIATLGLSDTPTSPPHPHTGLIFLFLWVYFFAVQINPRPPSRPAGGSSTRQCGPCEGHHLWHPEGRVRRGLLFLPFPSSILYPNFPHLGCLCPPLSFASVPLSSRSPESETSVRRKVSLVLDQMQPLVVSGLLLVGASVRVGAFWASGSGCGLFLPSTPHPMSLADGFSWFC